MVNPMPKITLLPKWYKGKHLQNSAINIVARYKKGYTTLHGAAIVQRHTKENEMENVAMILIHGAMGGAALYTLLHFIGLV
jgi:hypothetical protein